MKFATAASFSLASSGFTSSKYCLIYINKTQALKKAYGKYKLNVPYTEFSHTFSVNRQLIKFMNFRKVSSKCGTL